MSFGNVLRLTLPCGKVYASPARHKGLSDEPHRSREPARNRPVCGMSVDPDTADASPRPRGNDLFLLLRRVPHKFAAEILRRLSGPKPAASVPTGLAGTFCPDGPEVRRGRAPADIAGVAHRAGATRGSGRWRLIKEHETPAVVCCWRSRPRGRSRHGRPYFAGWLSAQASTGSRAFCARDPVSRSATGWPFFVRAAASRLARESVQHVHADRGRRSRVDLQVVATVAPGPFPHLLAPQVARGCLRAAAVVACCALRVAWGGCGVCV